MKLFVTGGYFDGVGEGFVDQIDLAHGRRERVISFVPPEPHRVPTKGLTGADWHPDGSLLVCGFDSVWRFDIATGHHDGQLHQPDFNDLHDVCVADGHIYVCNTGLDSVEVFDLAGSFVGRIGLTPAWFEAARQRGAAVAREELRRVFAAGWEPTPTPPLTDAAGHYYTAGAPFHRSRVRDYAHPNHIALVEGRLAVTLLAGREVRCARSLRTLARLPGHPHDGVWVDGRLWLTTTDGRVWRLSLDGHPAVPELVADTAATGHFGWCRGLAVGPDWIAVGLTEIRSAPRFAWRDTDYARTETSVLWLDRRSGSLRGRIDLTESRHAKVFALLPPPSPCS